MMSETEAAWVREQVWTSAMRRAHAEVPGYLGECPCEYQARCPHGEQCTRREPLARPIGVILRPGGEQAACFPEPFAHPTPTAVGPQRTAEAQIWYADHTCRWVCTCECHSEPDPEQVLAFVVRLGLVPPETTMDELPPPAFRAYRVEIVHQARLRDLRARRERQFAAEQQRAAERDRAYRAARARSDRIRDWARERGWPIRHGRVPRAAIEAYQVAVEGQAGQGSLF
ncbi:hypothetical protein ABZ801_00965 [Actinomadura sp. NPDC047616]|uniref:hypothetical protein n=1 Tax=Actinomadura sp. NPDC047616 TaxID=3155914 RepID=UPI0033D47A16